MQGHQEDGGRSGKSFICPLPGSCYSSLGAPCWCARIPSQSLGKEGVGQGRDGRPPPAPAQTAFTAASENGCPPPAALSSLPPPTPASPTSRDILIRGRRGVPTFWEPSLCQSEVTPRTMSQPSHLQQALWGQEPGPWSLPTWSLEASSYPLQPSLLPGSPVPLAEVVRGRKAGLSCGC